MIRRVLLLSGTRAERNTSFTRQLTLLARAFARAGIQAAVAGSDALTRMTTDSSVDAVILLGYPDQFPSLSRGAARDDGAPLFLWAQFSSPPACGQLGPLVFVPLTGKSASFLEQGGCARVGPVIPHGIDDGVYRPREDAEVRRFEETCGLDGCFTVGTVCANNPRKRLSDIVDSFALFHRVNRKSRLLVKTDRAVSHDGFDLRACLERHGVVNDAVILAEDLPEDRMCLLYNGMDVYINLSEWEGFCIPVIESMACGTPVLCQRGQGPGEIVPYDELMALEGRIVREGEARLLHADTEEAASLLVKAASSPSLLSSLAERGRRAVESVYRIERVASRWRDCMREYS